MANVWSSVAQYLGLAMRRVGPDPQEAGVRSELVGLAKRFDALESRVSSGLSELRRDGISPGAVYLGGGRVLCRLHLPERLYPDVIYIVDGADLTFVPRLIMDGIYEPEETRFAARLINETSHCVDVGANFGYFTCALGRMAWRGWVVGIEPDPEIAALLQVNVEINWISKVARVLNNAAADKPGRLRLRRHRGYSANTTIAGVEKASESPNREVFEVEAIPVDSLLPQLGGRVDFLKVDVEGAEPLVFRGARETIARNRQITVLMEWSPEQLRAAGFDAAEFTEELSSLSLVPACLQAGGETKPISWADVSAMSYGNIVMRRRDA